MDPLAHTLVGAALGRAVAGRDVPAAGWIGAIAANAPDWSELVLKPDLWPPRAGGEYLVFHRGITHSFVGGAATTSSCGGYGWRWWGARRQAWWAGPGTGSEWRAGAGRRRMGWWCSRRTPPRTPGRASWPRRRFAPPRHSGSAPTPAGRRSPLWGD